MRSFGTVQEAVDFIMSSERPEELEVCVSLLPSGTEKRVFSWDLSAIRMNVFMTKSHRWLLPFCGRSPRQMRA